MKRIVLIIFVALLGLNDGAQSDDSSKNSWWYDKAEEYIYYDEKLIENLGKEEDSFVKDYEARYQAKTDLLLSASPPTPKICELLVSSSMLDRKVALVNIMTRQKTYNRDIYSRIISLLLSDNDYFTRFYSYQCFNLLDAYTILHFKDDLIDVFSFEENEILIIAGMPALVSIDSPQIVPIFLKYLDQGSDGLKRAVCVSLLKVEREYFEENKSFLRKRIKVCGE